VSVVGDDGIDALGPELRYTVRVELATSDGRVLTGEASDRPGGPTRPLTAGQVHEKFLGLASPIVGDRQAREIEDVVGRIDELTGPGDLLRLMKRNA
jgi:hypothetical protein